MQENGLFWVTRIPDESVDEVKPAEGKARLVVEDLETEDYRTLENALLDGPSVEARVSFDCRWRHAIETRQIHNGAVDQQFRGTFTQTDAQVEWSAREKDVEFRCGSGLRRNRRRLLKAAADPRRVDRLIPLALIMC